MNGLVERMNIVCGKKMPKELYVYAHNSGLFDLHVLLADLTKLHTQHRKMIPQIIADNQNDIYQMMITYKGINIFFRDSMKIFPMSLKAVGANILAVDMGKMIVDHDAVRAIMLRQDRAKHLTH